MIDTGIVSKVVRYTDKPNEGLIKYVEVSGILSQPVRVVVGLTRRDRTARDDQLIGRGVVVQHSGVHMSPITGEHFLVTPFVLGGVV